MVNGKLGRCLIIANSADNLMTYHQLLSKSYITQTASTFDSTFDLIDDFEPEVIIIDERIINSSAIEIANHIRNDHVANVYFAIIVVASSDCKDKAQLQELTRADFIIEGNNVEQDLVNTSRTALRIKRLEDMAHGLTSKLAITNEMVKELESQDSITKLFNLPYMNYLLETEFQRAIRFDTPLAVLLVSIDNFIEMSHREGPQTCIKVIQQLGADLKSILRTEDFLGRSWGGVFICILPATHESGALVLAKRIKECVVAKKYGQDHPHSITISQGVGYFHPLKAKIPNIHELLIDAEQNLSKAKDSGSNQIYCRKNNAS